MVLWWSNTECAQTMQIDDGTTWHLQSSKDIKARDRSHALKPADWSNSAGELARFVGFALTD
jgi:hypothetical protein